MSETRTRSIAKALTWRLLATLTTALVVLLVSGELMLAVTVASFEVFAKLVVYYLHERTWSGIAWGVQAPRLTDATPGASEDASA